MLAEPTRAPRDVLEILAAPIVTVGLTPLLAVAGRAANVGSEHDVTGVDEDLRRDVPLAVMLRSRTAVNVDDGGRRARAMKRLGVREEEERGHHVAVRPRIADVPRFD